MRTLLRLGLADHGHRVSVKNLARADYEPGYKYEVIDGRLYVSPEAQLPENRLESWLYRKLWDYADRHPEVVNYVSNKSRVFVPGRKRTTVPEPDIAVYSSYPLERPIDEPKWEDVSPIVVGEVLYASDPYKDLVRNVELFLQVPSIREYWILDARAYPDEPTLIVRRRRAHRWVKREFLYRDTLRNETSPGLQAPNRSSSLVIGMPLSLNYLPRLPARRNWRIGCIGAGFIMRDCHLVAYRDAGFNPVAIASRNFNMANEVATRHAIPVVHSTIDELLNDNSIDVLDVAVPPDVQPGLILEAAKRKLVKGILAQKPLAMSVREARDCIEACERADIKLAVNQNMRYDQSIRAMKSLLNTGSLGEIVLASIEMRAIPHWMPWSRELQSLSTFVMSIHHLDTFRYWFGTPDRVLASTRPDPRTQFPHSDGINLYILEYDSGIRATSMDDVWAGPAREGAAADIGIRWRVEGTNGMARGTIGWPSYPERTPSTLDYTLIGEAAWHSPRWNEAWFPDAFVGTMAQLLVALEEGQEPEIGGRDNLETIALCEAVFAAAKEHRVTSVREFLT